MCIVFVYFSLPFPAEIQGREVCGRAGSRSCWTPVAFVFWKGFHSLTKSSHYVPGREWRALKGQDLWVLPVAETWVSLSGPRGDWWAQGTWAPSLAKDSPTQMKAAGTRELKIQGQFSKWASHPYPVWMDMTEGHGGSGFGAR